MIQNDNPSRVTGLLHSHVVEPAEVLPFKLEPGLSAWVLETANDAIFLYDEQGHILYANAAACRQTAYQLDELLQLSIRDLDSELAITSTNLPSLLPLGESRIFGTCYRSKSGALLPVEVSMASASFQGRTVNSALVRDVGGRKEPHDDEQRFRLIADTSPVGLIISDSGAGRIHYANTQAAKLFECSREQLLEQNLIDVLKASTTEPDLFDRNYPDEQLQSIELQLQHGDLIIWVSLNTSMLMLEGVQMQCTAIMDVTEAYELSNQLSYQAAYDDLTGLVNRREFEDRLQEVIDIARERHSDNVLCYLDLDQFKVINDTCGHMAGDELLRQLARELYRCVRRDDTLARLGGDEFAILLENCSIENAERVADNVREMVQNFRFFWQESVFTIGVSIGLTLIAQEGETISEVLRRADTACYAAKEAGRNRLHVFRFDDRDLEQRHVEMRWVARIQAALDENRFELWYQEIAEIQRDDASGSQTAGDHFEVLLRLRDTDGTLIQPGIFLPAAERYALAVRIDRWVLHALFRWLADNPRNRDRMGLCSVNLSGQTLGDETFHQEVIAILEDSDIPADRLCFEITETSAIANLANATRFMQRLQMHGCTFALDDFGSGLSSFAYLKSLPVDFVKIDGLFVKDILSDPVDRAMVKAIIDMAHAMGKKAIAEFVENDAILQELIDLGIDYVQGFGIARPQPLR
jgi:diguanylate cyclase (GGDEF)-like protein/PAS domain S-box-containing protein